MLSHRNPTKTEIPRQINASVLPPPISPLRMQRVKSGLFVGGGWWIRTTEVSDNRFTVCPLWPLGKSPIWSPLFAADFFGAGDRSRTNNLLITNQLLCHWATPAFGVPYWTSDIIPQRERFVNTFLKDFLIFFKFFSLLAVWGKKRLSRGWLFM